MNHLFYTLLCISLLVSCQSDTQTKSKEVSADISSIAKKDTLPTPDTTQVRQDEEQNKNKLTEQPVIEKEIQTQPKSEETINTPIAEKQKKVVELLEIKEKVVAVEQVEQEVSTTKMPDHSAWNSLLYQYVSSTGQVNYKNFKADEASLQDYLDDLSAHPPQENWNKNEKLAYWINAYNAFTIKLIIDHYPVSSITDLHGGKPWDVKWIKLGDTQYSLNNIENDIIRPKFGDARIHFAVNCAAKSCPPLLNEAFLANKLNSQLEQQTKKFINNVSYNQISDNSITISKIFDWYKADFSPSLVDYINEYASTRISEGANIKFKEYDWSLNN
jgi:hypothetical protein